MTYRIGVHAGHDANACIASGSTVLAYANAERSDGCKQSSNYIEAIRSVLDQSGVLSGEVSRISMSTTQGWPLYLINPKIFNIKSINMVEGCKIIHSPDSIKEASTSSKYLALFSDLSSSKLPALVSSEKPFPGSLVLSGICNFYGKEIEFELVDHHYAHLTSAFIRYNKASIAVSLDGSGGTPSRSIGVPTWGGMSAVRYGNKIKIAPLPLFKGGIIYSSVAQGLGLSEGKLMGLSSYFKISSQSDCAAVSEFHEMIEGFCRSLESEAFSIDDTKTSLSGEMLRQIDKDWFQNFQHHLDLLLVRGRELFDLRSCLEGSHQLQNIQSLPPVEKIVASGIAQKIFEDLRIKCISKQIQYLVEKDSHSHSPSVVLTGGCTLNCPSNRDLATSGIANFYFDNACNDEGLSIGAMLASEFTSNPDSVISKTSKTEFLSTPFLGSYVTRYPEAISMINESQDLVLINESMEEVVESIVNILANGKIVIVARGRYEAGPRALGARSLIGIAQDIHTHYILNEIKCREQWRPIAPAVRDKDFHDYFEGPMDSHMLMTNNVIRQSKIPAVTHVDGSARVQVVSNHENSFWPILSALSKKDFHPVIANTSLNIADEPLINSATRAVNLMQKNLDTIHAIWFDDFLVVRK